MKYSTNQNNLSSRNEEQINQSTGAIYRASGNLFIVKQIAKVIPKAYCGIRGDVVNFSAGSGIRMRRYLRECMAEYKYMVTLTYPHAYPSNGTETKEHLRRFLQEVQRWDMRENGSQGGSDKHSAFWFLEFQARGAPHYHIFVNRCPKKEWVSRRWYEIVKSEDVRHLYAGTRTEKLVCGRAGTISYASKYAAKAAQKIVPAGFEKIGRFWGVYGMRATMAADIFVSREEASERRVQKSIEKLISIAKQAVSEGKAEVIKREEGVLIIVFFSEWYMRKMRMYVSVLSSKVSHQRDYFSDAEMEYGGIYDA